MKIKSAEFKTSAVGMGQFPADGLPEIALVGRSNVGKSSLINCLVGRKKLAKTSSTPGKTRTVNFYTINNAFYLVDLPGYGYAKVAKSMRKDWERMMNEYLESRETLAGVMVVLDPRRDPGELEGFVYDWVERYGVSVVTVLTKSDKLSRNKLASRRAKLKKALPVDDFVFFSATTGAGRDELSKTLSAMVHGVEDETAPG